MGELHKVKIVVNRCLKLDNLRWVIGTIFYRCLYPLEFILVRYFWFLAQTKSEGKDIQNTRYHVIHRDLGIAHRNENAAQIHSIFYGTEIGELTAPTCYFNSLDLAEAYIAQNFGIRVKSNEIHGDNGEVTYKFPWFIGSVGYYASLIHIIKNFLVSNAENLIVFEDDYRVRKDFISMMQILLHRVPKNWELLKLNQPNLNQYNSFLKNRSSELFFPKLFSPWGCGCFILNRISAMKILEDLKNYGIRAPVDIYLYNFDSYSKFKLSLQLYEINPFLPIIARSITSPNQSTLEIRAIE